MLNIEHIIIKLYHVLLHDIFIPTHHLLYKSLPKCNINNLFQILLNDKLLQSSDGKDSDRFALEHKIANGENSRAGSSKSCACWRSGLLTLIVFHIWIWTNMPTADNGTKKWCQSTIGVYKVFLLEVPITEYQGESYWPNVTTIPMFVPIR